ncbi:hypothetical protein BT63DRAFT_471374 [Microthyrium microscopicum]|uniref:Uncharacterized protein n=1 Tax=Microthyrium microscopicum TaxID=703497 RepID=A0A6A6U9S7_9PEZI|nr:hypothetical protein BT63DRAFT_471374 [Microthyrium microscopicum]
MVQLLLMALVAFPVATLAADPDPRLICPPTLSETDPASWQKSGAQDFLDNFLKGLGDTDNWIQQLDSQTSFGGGFSSTLDCREIVTSGCDNPTVDCTNFTPPPVFWIRLAAFKIHDFYAQAHSALVDSTLLNILAISSIVNDFMIAPPDTTGKGDLISNILKQVSPIFSIADKLLKLTGGQFGDQFGLVGAAVSLAGAVVTANDPTMGMPANTVNDLTSILNAQLSNVFNTTATNLATSLFQIMGGIVKDGASVDILPVLDMAIAMGNAGPVNASLSPISNIFRTGTFLRDPFDGASLNSGLTDGFNQVNQQLVGAVLSAQGIVVYQNTALTDANVCGSIAGSKFLDNTCFTFEVVNIPGQKNPSSPLSMDIVNKLASHSVDQETVFRNAQACNNNLAPIEPGIAVLGFNGDLPPCAFGLIFVSQPTDICGGPNGPFGGPSGFPASLNFDQCNNAPPLSERTFTEAGGFATPVPDVKRAMLK